MKRPEITDEMFDRELARLAEEAAYVDDEGRSALLRIPGIYEILSEHFNNDILDNLSDDSNDFESVTMDDPMDDPMNDMKDDDI